MIEGRHIKLGGVLYNLAESHEGSHYVEGAEPLRSPGAQVVEGAEKFNLRPDVLSWSWTSWTGGAFQFRYDRKNPNGYWTGVGIDPISVPGALQVARKAELTLDELAATLTISGNEPLLLTIDNSLFLVDGANIRTWGGSAWGASAAITGVTTGVFDGDTDGQFMWLIDDDSIIRRDAAGTTVDFATNVTSGLVAARKAVVSLGGFVYAIYHTTTGFDVQEYDKSAATPVAGTLLVDENFVSTTVTAVETSLRKRVTKSHNRIYVALPISEFSTVIYEIIPSSATDTGRGKLIGTVDAHIRSIHWSAGLLYMHVIDRLSGKNAGTLMYLDPLGGTYGAVATLWGSERTPNGGESVMRGSRGLTTSLLSVEASQGPEVKNFGEELLLLDMVAGALHPLYTYGRGASEIYSLAYSGGSFFVANSRVLRVQLEGTTYQYLMPQVGTTGSDQGDMTPHVISPVYDYGILEHKILAQIKVSTKSIPTNWSIQIQYQKDEDGTWTTAGTAVAGATETEITLPSPVVFWQIRLRVNFIWSGGGDPTTTPVLLGVETWAVVGQRLRTWTLMLDCSDDVSHTGAVAFTGKQKVENVRALDDTGSTVTFLDGYLDPKPASFTTHTVVLDAMTIDLERPGQGVAVVRLTEVA